MALDSFPADGGGGWRAGWKSRETRPSFPAADLSRSAFFFLFCLPEKKDTKKKQFFLSLVDLLFIFYAGESIRLLVVSIFDEKDPVLLKGGQQKKN